jgi:hypothetical protein
MGRNHCNKNVIQIVNIVDLSAELSIHSIVRQKQQQKQEYNKLSKYRNDLISKKEFLFKASRAKWHNLLLHFSKVI